MKDLSRSIKLIGLRTKTKALRSCWAFVFLLGLSLLKGQELCDRYMAVISHASEFSTSHLDSLTVELADQHYWDEWYRIIKKINNRKAKKSISDAAEYLDLKEQTTRISDLKVAGEFFYLKAWMHNKDGNLYRAIKVLEKSYGFFQRMDHKSYQKRCLWQFSYFYSKFNDHYTAIEYGNLYIDQLEPNDSINISKAHKNLSAYHFYAGKYKKAREHNEKALNYNENYQLESRISSIKIYTALKEYKVVDSLLKDASNSYAESSKFYYPLKRLEADYYAKISNYRKSIAIRKGLLADSKTGFEPREKMKIRQSLANDYFELGNYDLALKETHKIQQFFVMGFDEEDVMIVPDSNQLIPEAWLMESLLLKAKIFDNMPHTVSLENTLKTYEKSMFVLDLLRENYKTIGSVFDIGATDFAIFENAIDCCWKNYHVSGRTILLERALYYSQLAKSYTLKKSRSFRDILEESKVPKIIKQNYLKYLILSQKSVENKNMVYDSVDYYYQKILEHFPEFEKQTLIKTIDVKSIQNSLDCAEAVLNYFVGGDKIFLFALAKNGLRWVSMQKPVGLDSLVDVYHKSLSDINYILGNPNEAEKSYLSTTHTFYQLLFSSIEDFLEEHEVQNIGVVPDDFMNEISFESLKTLPDSSWFSFENYLIDKYAVHYLFYLGELLSDKYLESRIIDKASIFGLDYSSYPDHSLAKLNNTLKECEEVYKVVGGELFANTKVEESTFLSSVSQSDLIHYSGHSIHNIEDYTKSYLPLYSRENRAGQLYYSDVASISCNAALVSLSACHTHDGKKERTEGLISMARAFKESGASACLGSLWSASDQSSKKILQDFYLELENGMSKSCALQNSMMNYLKDPEVPSKMKVPFYWSNWKLYGSPASIEIHNGPNRMILYSVMGIALLIAAISFLKKEH